MQRELAHRHAELVAHAAQLGEAPTAEALHVDAHAGAIEVEHLGLAAVIAREEVDVAAQRVVPELAPNQTLAVPAEPRSVMSLMPSCLAARLMLTPARLAYATAQRCISLGYRGAPRLRV